MESKQTQNNAISIVIIGLVAGVLSIPLFIFLYNFFPELSFTYQDKMIRFDHIILFLTLFFLLYYLLKKLRVIIYILLTIGGIVFTITNFAEIYTFSNLYHDSLSFLTDLSKHSLKEKFFFREINFRQEDRLRTAIDYKEPLVRNYAVNIANKHFNEKQNLSPNLKWVHFFSIFKEINSKWNYVYDPKNEEYYAKASETIGQLNFDNSFKGDCDDHSILMAACIKAVGGEVRLVRTKVKQKDGSQIGHMYPEVKFGTVKDLEKVVYLIKNIYFTEETKNKTIHYYQDPKGFIWLNFDYNDNYPGNPYQSNIRESEIEV
ncbi:MAG TPA: transglutaminase family protein [Crocinitomix sp.]|nr:transglutaminase family protein [Crocinitomix sp.]